MLITANAIFFFQAEDGIRDRSVSRGLGDVYKRQDYKGITVAEDTALRHELRENGVEYAVVKNTLQPP